jgi:hypothetical protein
MLQQGKEELRLQHVQTAASMNFFTAAQARGLVSLLANSFDKVSSSGTTHCWLWRLCCTDTGPSMSGAGPVATPLHLCWSCSNTAARMQDIQANANLMYSFYASITLPCNSVRTLHESHNQAVLWQMIVIVYECFNVRVTVGRTPVLLHAARDTEKAYGCPIWCSTPYHALGAWRNHAIRACNTALILLHWNSGGGRTAAALPADGPEQLHPRAGCAGLRCRQGQRVDPHLQPQAPVLRSHSEPGGISAVSCHSLEMHQRQPSAGDSRSNANAA